MKATKYYPHNRLRSELHNNAAYIRKRACLQGVLSALLFWGMHLSVIGGVVALVMLVSGQWWACRSRRMVVQRGNH